MPEHKRELWDHDSMQLAGDLKVTKRDFDSSMNVLSGNVLKKWGKSELSANSQHQRKHYYSLDKIVASEGNNPPPTP